MAADVRPAPRALVVGAGVAGLQAARALQARAGADVVIAEKAGAVGGVWRENYAGWAAQVPRLQYHLPELGVDKSALDWYPTGEQLGAHCRDFVDAFGLRPSLRLGCDVTQLRRLEGGRWRATIRRAGNTAAEQRHANGSVEEDFDWVVVATGNFSRTRVPEVPGAEDFEGRRLHSSELLDVSVLRGRRVVVVGGGKSALDIFASATAHAKAVALVVRAPGWVLPRRFLGLPLRYLAATRWFAWLVLPPYYTTGLLGRMLGVLAFVVQSLLWLMLAPLLWLHFRMPRAMWPTTNLRWQLWHGHSVAICDPKGLRAAFEQPCATPIRGHILRFERRGLVVQDALAGKPREVPADTVVFATGYRESWSQLFDDATRRVLDPAGEGPELYRQILPLADLPGLAFVGRVLSTADIVAAFVQAEWLAAIVSGAMEPPLPLARRSVFTRHRVWRRQFRPCLPSTYVATPRLFDYLDELVADLRAAGRAGAPARALPRGPSALLRSAGQRLRAWVVPLAAADYAALAQSASPGTAGAADFRQAVPRPNAVCRPDAACLAA